MSSETDRKTFTTSTVSQTVSGAFAAQSCNVIMAARGAQKALKIGWIGAGSINFGSLEGPWNHAARLQKQAGVEFSAIVEPNLDLAQVRALSSSLVHACSRSPKDAGAVCDSDYRHPCRNGSRSIQRDPMLTNGKVAKSSKTITAC